jgi:hypothetical protein
MEFILDGAVRVSTDDVLYTLPPLSFPFSLSLSLYLSGKNNMNGGLLYWMSGIKQKMKENHKKKQRCLNESRQN